MECLSKETTEHFECNDAGIPSIKEGYCDSEQADFVNCIR